MSEREFMLQLSEAEVAALIEAMFLAAEADGDVGADELGELSSSIERVTSGAVSKQRAQVLVESARAALAGSDRPTRLSAVKAALSPAQCKHALLLAIQVTAADGRIRTSERELILETAEALDIDGDTAADLVKVVSQSSS
jgi:tellurite resistance protein